MTSKLKLDLAELRVESFRVAGAADARGTVRGAADALGAALPGAGGDSGCTDPCMSYQSQCPILSCGSGCDPETQPAGPGTGI